MTLRFVDMPWLLAAGDDWMSRCKAVPQDTPNAAEEIQRLARCALDPSQSLALSRALKRCRKNAVDLAPLSDFRLGILAANTLDLVVDCLPAGAARHGVALDTVSFPYGQVLQTIFAPDSPLRDTRLDAVLVSVDHRWLGLDTAALDGSANARVDKAIEDLKAIVEGVRETAGASVILQTIALPNEPSFGGIDPMVNGSVRDLVARCNRRIVDLASDTNALLLDVAAIVSRVGSDVWFNPIQWASYKLPFDAGMAPVFAEYLGRLLGAMRGKSAKCLVLDLDNTLWGGVVGDDGLDGIKVGPGSAAGEAHAAVQRAALALRERGIFLAVASKNQDAIAR